MSDQLNDHTHGPVLLVGAGAMAVEYARVLTHLGEEVVCVGRGPESAASFEVATGIPVGTGPLVSQLGEMRAVPERAIVAVNAMHLTDVTVALLAAGVQRVLVEKPGALDTDEMERLAGAAVAASADVRIGFNRRYLPSVVRARTMIAEDGGPLSVKFDFSEPSRRIAQLSKPERELRTWFYGNSLHVVDLAVHLGGGFDAVSGRTTGSVSWHPDGAVFVGHARLTGGGSASWHANWTGPGRWGLEGVTAERRLILQPLEQLRVQDHGSFAEHDIELDTEVAGLKPGLLGQTHAFLTGSGADALATVAEQSANWPVYDAIRVGTDHPTKVP